jgi:hypothetical protein
MDIPDFQSELYGHFGAVFKKNSVSPSFLKAGGCKGFDEVLSDIAHPAHWWRSA